MQSLHDSIIAYQQQAQKVSEDLEKAVERIATNEALSAKGKREQQDAATERYKGAVAQIRAAADAEIEAVSRRLPKLRKAARETEERQTRDLLGDALAAQAYLRKIAQIEGQTLVDEYDAATPWQKALFALRPEGETPPDMRLQERIDADLPEQAKEAERLGRELALARSALPTLDPVGMRADMVSRFNIR